MILPASFFSSEGREFNCGEGSEPQHIYSIAVIVQLLSSILIIHRTRTIKLGAVDSLSKVSLPK